MLFNITEAYAKNKAKIQEAFILAATGKKPEPASRPGTYKYVGLPWPLPNMEPTSELQFWGYRSSWQFAAEIREQFIVNGVAISAIIYYIDTEMLGRGGFVVVPSRTKVEYFKWTACKHEFDQSNAGRCLTNYRCTKCGHAFQWDSSD